MIFFSGFTGRDLLKSKDINPEFTINVVHEYNYTYTKKLSNLSTDEELMETIKEIMAFIQVYKKDEILHLCNFVDFLIWVDEKTSYKYTSEIFRNIHEVISISVKIDYVMYLIANKELCEKYQLIYLLEDIWEEDISIYQDEMVVSSLRVVCETYNLNFKERFLKLLSRYLNDTIIKIIDENFEIFLDSDFMNIIYYSKNTDNIQAEFTRLTLFNQIMKLLLDK